MSGVDPENPGEDEEEESEVISLEEVELIPPEEIIIEDPSLIRKTVWLKPKTVLYFDLARHGAFDNAEGARNLGSLSNFKGNLSDFFNELTDICFNYLANRNIGLQKYVEEIEVS